MHDRYFESLSGAASAVEGEGVKFLFLSEPQRPLSIRSMKYCSLLTSLETKYPTGFEGPMPGLLELILGLKGPIQGFIWGRESPS